MSKTPKDAWIDADGKACPVPHETLVDVKFRDGTVWRLIDAGWFDEGESNWVHDGTHCDITHFQQANV